VLSPSTQLLDLELQIKSALLLQLDPIAQLPFRLDHTLRPFATSLLSLAVLLDVIVARVTLEHIERIALIDHNRLGAARVAANKREVDDSRARVPEQLLSFGPELNVAGDCVCVAVDLDVLHKVAVADQLPQDPLNVVLFVGFHFAVHFELVVAVLDNLGVHGALEDLAVVEQSGVRVSDGLDAAADG